MPVGGQVGSSGSENSINLFEPDSPSTGSSSSSDSFNPFEPYSPSTGSSSSLNQMLSSERYDLGCPGIGGTNTTSDEVKLLSVNGTERPETDLISTYSSASKSPNTTSDTSSLPVETSSYEEKAYKITKFLIENSSTYPPNFDLNPFNSANNPAVQIDTDINIEGAFDTDGIEGLKKRVSEIVESLDSKTPFAQGSVTTYCKNALGSLSEENPDQSAAILELKDLFDTQITPYHPELSLPSGEAPRATTSQPVSEKTSTQNESTNSSDSQ